MVHGFTQPLEYGFEELIRHVVKGRYPLVENRAVDIVRVHAGY